MTARWGGWAAVAYAVAMVAAVATQGLVVGLRVVTPAELLVDVARNRAAWVVAQGVLAAAQVLLVPVGVAFVVAFGGRRRAVPASGVALLGAAGILQVMSALFHGVLGVHLAAPAVARQSDRPSILRHVEIVHAFGDTAYFLGGIAAGLGILVLAVPVARDRRFPMGLWWLAVATAVCGAVQFAWFVAPAAGVAAPFALALQAAWFAWAGVRLVRLQPDAGQVPAAL